MSDGRDGVGSITFRTRSVEGTEAVGEALGGLLRAGDGVALIGDLGAGKTAFTRGLARGLALDEPDAVASPTYLVAIEHEGPTPMLHIDAYLGTKAESFLLDGGLDYATELGAVLVVEWADRIRSLWPPRTVEVTLDARVTGADPTGPQDPSQSDALREIRIEAPIDLLRGLDGLKHAAVGRIGESPRTR